MVSTLAREFQLAMKEENITLPEIYKAFKKPVPEEFLLNQPRNKITKQISSLRLEHTGSIVDVYKPEWNKLFENKGTFDWEGLKILENAFTSKPLGSATSDSFAKATKLSSNSDLKCSRLLAVSQGQMGLIKPS